MTRKESAVLGQKSRAHSRAGERLEKPALSRRMYVDIVAVIDIVLVIGSAFLIKYLYLNSYVETFSGGGLSDGRTSYLTVTALVTGSLFAALGRRQHYSSESFENWEFKREFVRLAFAVLFSFGFALLVVFSLKESALFSRVWVLTWCASVFVILFTGKFLWSHQFRALAAKGYFRRRTLLVGGGDALAATRDSLLSAQSQIDLVCVNEIDLLRDSAHSGGCLAEAAVGEAIARGQAGGLDEVVVALPSSENELLDQIVRKLRLLPVELKVALDLGSSSCKFVDIGRFGSTNFASVQMKPISEWNVLLKACEDYLFASLALLIFLPAMVLIAIAIKLDSKGPVLFRQRRHGSNHKVIQVLKFRSMTVAEDGDKITQAGKNDKRITRVGRFLRKTSLDELPQLINVLKGEMSLVGPRPHALSHNTEFSLMFENYASRHRVKPGMTGWAQVNGFRGEITDPGLLEKRVQYDLEYIEDWSIWLDMQILFMTPIFGFVSKRAY